MLEVATLQLVLREDPATAGERLLALPSDAGHSPADFDKGHDRALPLGSAGLVEAALRMRAAGYLPVDVDLVDYNFEPYESSTDDIAQQVVQVLANKTDATARSELASLLRGVYVLAVYLRDSGPQNGQVRLVQDGIITTSSPVQLTKIAAVLAQALGYVAA